MKKRYDKVTPEPHRLDASTKLKQAQLATNHSRQELNARFKEFKVFHLFSGSGGGALGFQDSEDEFKGIIGKFRTLGGVDVDPLACEDFKYLTGVQATQMDLFERRDYVAFHGHEPGAEWHESTTEDLLAAAQGEYPDVIFLSPPCKGLSGLLPQKTAETEKYQALNRLVIRGMFLALETFKTDLPSIILLENVPRINSGRGKKLLHTIKEMLRSYGYVIDDRTHDCGELGGLGQHRKRYLLIARNLEKIPVFVYQPPKQRVKSIGEIIGPLPLPDDPRGGDMHRLPRLQVKTWKRLALIPAGGDWRDLERIAPEKYWLEYVPRGGGPYGVMDWDKPSCTVIGNAGIKGSNAAAVGDPRLKHYGSNQESGASAIGDLRTGFNPSTHTAIYQVNKWGEVANTVTGAHGPNNGAISIADPRLNQRHGRYSGTYKVIEWDQSCCTIISQTDLQTGALSVADTRLGCKPRSGTMGVQDWNKPGKTVIGSGDIHAGAVAIGDTRLRCNSRPNLYGSAHVTSSNEVAAVVDPGIPGDNERPDPPPIIISLDGHWHRPLTTLELAILQGLPLMVNGKPLRLAGKSDASWRERIGNMVPPGSAKAMGEVSLHALLVASEGITWEMSALEVWVTPNEKEPANHVPQVRYYP
jgi:site-specific DNA-cytosine methylase